MSIESPRFTLPPEKLEEIKPSRLDSRNLSDNLPSYLLVGKEIRKRLEETTKDKVSLTYRKIWTISLNFIPK